MTCVIVNNLMPLFLNRLEFKKNHENENRMNRVNELIVNVKSIVLIFSRFKQSNSKQNINLY